jgi:arginase family enzyme
VSQPATARAAVIAMRCRGGAPDDPVARGVEHLSESLGRLTGVVPRAIGSFREVPAQYGEDLEASRGCLLEAGGQLQDALYDGARPVLVAGDAAIGLTTLPALSRLRPDARALWLSARASFHTPQTTADGRLAGMALAGACGRWGTGFDGAISGRRVILCGADALQEGEREALDGAGVTVIGSALETLVFLQNALDGAPAYVHLDVGVLDSGPQEGGLSEEKLFDLLDAVADSSEVLGLQVSGLVAPESTEAARAVAERVAALLVPLLP